MQRLPLYDGPVLQGMMFTYTPFAGILFTVWAVLTFQQAIVVWSALNVVALFAVVVLCWKYLGYRLDVKAYAVSGVGHHDLSVHGTDTYDALARADQHLPAALDRVGPRSGREESAPMESGQASPPA